MNKYMVFFMLLFSGMANAAFVNPMDFDGSDTQKQEVIKYIQDRVKHEYCDSGIDMCQETILRSMEQQNLSAFKELTNAKDKKIMDNVIHTYCGSVDMCNYVIIRGMYNQNLSASKEQLEW